MYWIVEVHRQYKTPWCTYFKKEINARDYFVNFCKTNIKISEESLDIGLHTTIDDDLSASSGIKYCVECDKATDYNDYTEILLAFSSFKDE